MAKIGKTLVMLEHEIYLSETENPFILWNMTFLIVDYLLRSLIRGRAPLALVSF